MEMTAGQHSLVTTTELTPFELLCEHKIAEN